MRLKFSRSIGVVFGIIAVLVIAPAICAASTDTMGIMDMPSETQGSVPQCFSVSSSMPSHHILMNAVGNQVKPHRFVLNSAESFSWHPVSLTVEPSASQTKYVRKDIEYKIPLSPSVAYHCRNYLSSEEPPL